MFGFIKKLINGILAFVTGLFSKKSADAPSAVPQPKRNSGYFMELDDSPANGQPAKIEAAKAEPPKAQPAKAEATKVEATKVEAPKAPEPAAQPGKAEARKAARAEAAKAEATPAPAQPAPATNNQNGQKSSEPAIAFSSFGDRRRPGPNMSSFLDMARQVKVPT
uniref:hypothetical protein n=1 Tax=Trichocoleus desertorum TaxID=1481672 RepID=UPI0025B4531D|nr:hypothetical protein [Trichocoleus desertorum]